MLVLHVLLNSWASGFRIKATPIPGGLIHWVCLLKERFCSKGEGDFVPERESQGDVVISGLLWGQVKAKKLAHEKFKAIFARKTKCIGSF